MNFNENESNCWIYKKKLVALQPDLMDENNNKYIRK